MTEALARMTTLVAQLTPVGSAAVAVVAVEGPRAAAAVLACFQAHGRHGRQLPEVGRVLVGRWGPTDAAGGAELRTGEELVVCRTAEQRFEVHCHGGRAAVRAVIEQLCRQGCHEVDWRKLARSAGKSPIESAARQALASAATERAAVILLSQLNGALERQLLELQTQLGAGCVRAAQEILDRLLSHAPCGLHLAQPWLVVLVGPPNVGKSSLINALVGYQRAVVFETPGTTRDVVTATTAIEGWPVELCDTAGIRATDDPLEAIGVGRAQRQIGLADLVVLVRDATQADSGLTPSSPRVPASKPTLVVMNKTDLLDAIPASPSAGSDVADSIWTSAATGEGIEELIAAIGRQLVPSPPGLDEAVPFEREQVQRLHELRDCVLDGRLDVACRLLAEWLA